MKKTMKSKPVILILAIVGLFPATAYAQEDILDLEETEVKSSIPEPPDLSTLNTLRNPDKAIEIKLEESFIPKITESMKKNPF